MVSYLHCSLRKHATSQPWLIAPVLLDSKDLSFQNADLEGNEADYLDGANYWPWQATDCTYQALSSRSILISSASKK